MYNTNRFEGEDMAFEERKKMMAEQKNSWLEQQVQERRAAQDERKKAEAAYMVLYFNHYSRMTPTAGYRAPDAYFVLLSLS